MQANLAQAHLLGKFQQPGICQTLLQLREMGSNLRPRDYWSPALPSELSRQTFKQPASGGDLAIHPLREDKYQVATDVE